MFKNILVPISSEFYAKEVLIRSATLAKKFKSSITLIYIIEEKTLNQTDKCSDVYRTHIERLETRREIIKEQKLTAGTIVFEDAKRFFEARGIPLEEKIVEGEFSKVIKNELNNKPYDLIVMRYERGCTLNYRLFDDSSVSIWVETKSSGNTILAVCSNLAPNQKVPETSIALSKILKWNLSMIYVVDVQDAVEVDAQGKRSEMKSEEELMAKAEEFASEMQKRGAQIKLVKGSLEKETLKAAAEVEPGLVIVGREQKKQTMLGLPVKSVKKRMAEQCCGYSLLFVN